MENFIRQLPKAELHLHLEGTLEPELMFRIADENRIKLPYKSVAEVHEAYRFNNLQSFLDIYYAGMSVLRQEQDFYDLTWNYLLHAKQDGVRHVEVFFDPQAHTSRGIPFSTVIHGIHAALEDGENDLGISYKLIMCFLRDLTAESAMQTLQESLPFKKWIAAVGLDSAEKNNPPEKFREVFAAAQDQGFLTVAHAGEEGGADYVWQALDILKVSRIDHGVHCLQDPKLVEKLVAEQIPLTVCPLSNIKLHVEDSMQHHPLKIMLDKGLLVSVNSDDPAYFGGYVLQNYYAVQAALDLSQKDICQLAKNSFLSSFLSEVEKQKFITEIEKVCLI